MRKCWNRQTGTFEVRVSMTCGFKSHLPHQTKVPMAYPAMGIFVWYSELRACCKGNRRLRRIQGAGAGAAVEEGKRQI